MRLRSALMCLFSGLILTLAVACSKQEAPRQEAPPAAPAAGGAMDGKALFEQKCSVCHGLDRATSRKESKAKWTAIVKEMQGKKAGWISDAEADKIIDFLVADHGTK